MATVIYSNEALDDISRAYDDYEFRPPGLGVELNRLDRGNAAEFEVITLTP